MSCSAMKVRRFVAGELAGEEKDLTAAHLAACARCGATLREISEESEALRRDVPFDAFAAGVAERLAQRQSRRLMQFAPFAAAAGLLLVAGTVLVLRPSDDSSVRIKGAPGAQLFVRDARGVRELGTGPVAKGATLLLSLHPASRKHAQALLIEPGETTVLYDGPAVSDPLPNAFEWTGSGSATLRVVLSDAKGAAGDVIEFPLHR